MPATPNDPVTINIPVESFAITDVLHNTWKHKMTIKISRVLEGGVLEEHAIHTWEDVGERQTVHPFGFILEKDENDQPVKDDYTQLMIKHGSVFSGAKTGLYTEAEDLGLIPVSTIS